MGYCKDCGELNCQCDEITDLKAALKKSEEQVKELRAIRNEIGEPIDALDMQNYGVKITCEKLTAVLDGQDDMVGSFGYLPLQELRERLFALKKDRRVLARAVIRYADKEQIRINDEAEEIQAALARAGEGAKDA